MTFVRLSAFTVEPLEPIGRPDPAMMRLGKAQIRDALLQVLLETRHRRRVPILKPGDERAAPLERQLVGRRQKNLLDERLHLVAHQVRQLRQNVSHLVHLAPLPERVRPDALDRFDQARGAIHHHQERILQAAGR